MRYVFARRATVSGRHDWAGSVAANGAAVKRDASDRGLTGPEGALQSLPNSLRGQRNPIRLWPTRQREGGIEMLQTSLDQMQQMIKQEQASYSKVIRDLQVKVD